MGLKEPLLKDKVYILLYRDTSLLFFSALGLYLIKEDLLNNILLAAFLTVFAIFMILKICNYLFRIQRQNYYLFKDWYTRGTFADDEDESQVDYLEKDSTIEITFKNGKKLTLKKIDKFHQ